MIKRSLLARNNSMRIIYVPLVLIITVILISNSSISITVNNILDKKNLNSEIREKESVFRFETSTGLAPSSDIKMFLEKSRDNNYTQFDKFDYHTPNLFTQYMYGYCVGSGVVKIPINDPDNFTCECGYSMSFLSGGTWTCDGRWLAVEYFEGALWEIDPETGYITEIGGGGTGLNGLAEDPTTHTLYGCSSYDLMKIDPETGEQEVIGSFGTGQTHIAIAFDYYGTCYTWDVKFSGESYLYTVDLDTGEATIVGGMGVTLLYAQDGDFLRNQDILYLTAYIYNPVYGGYLCKVDKTTGELSICGGFEGHCDEITASMFIQDCNPTEHDIGVKEIVNPEDGYALDPLPVEVLVKNYGNNSEITDVKFKLIKHEEEQLIDEEHFDIWPPEGWEYFGYNHSDTNNALGEAPEIKYTYPPYISNGWIQSSCINVSGFKKISIKFKMLAEFSNVYSPYFYIHYRKNASSHWRNVSPWNNPVIDNLGPDLFEISCYDWEEDMGSEFQIRFYFNSLYYYLLYGSGIWIDDIYIYGLDSYTDYEEVVEDIEVPFNEEVLVDFPDWSPCEWQNPDYQDSLVEYPLFAYSLFQDNYTENNNKKRMLKLYYPFLHDVSTISLEGVDSGPAQIFPVKITIENLGQFDECCFKTYVEIAELDFDYAGLLLTEDFYPYENFPPSGWTRTNTKWTGSYSNKCGEGDYAEARFYYYPSEIDKFRLYTPALNTTDYGAVYIEFTHYVNHYTTPYILRVETSPDGVTWDSVWDIKPSGNVPAETVEIITGENVGTDSFHVSWTFDGFSWNINYWYVDMVTIKGIPISEPEYTDEVCVEEIIPGEAILYEFNNWEPSFLPLETSDQKIYTCKAWTSLDDPIDQNRTNDVFQKDIVLDYFHDVSVMTTSPSRSIDYDLIWDNGDTDGSNGYSLLGSPRRSILDDFQLHEYANIVEVKALVGYTGAHSQEWEITFWTDDDQDPGLEIETMVSTEFSEEATGRSWFGYAEYEISQMFEPFKMTPGYYWFELWPGSNAANTWWWRRTDYWRSQCWVNYDDYGFMPGQNNYGVPADVSYQLWGRANVDVYIATGNQDITALAENHGTFPEHNMTCYTEIFEYIIDCENGILVYEEMIEGIDILEPIGGSQYITFSDYNFATEGLYLLHFYLEDDNDDYPNNNKYITRIGVDETPPETFDPELDPLYPDGDNGWYVSDLEVTICAEDPEIGCNIMGSGVKEIRVRINEGNWQIFSDDCIKIIIKEDGPSHIEYYAIDNVGNSGLIKNFTILMDQTKPNIKHVEWKTYKKGVNWYVKFICEALDETSGMDRVELYIIDELYDNILGIGPIYEFHLKWHDFFELCEIKFAHFDTAGNSASNLINGSWIESYSRDKINIFQWMNIWLQRFLERFPLLKKFIRWLII